MTPDPEPGGEGWSGVFGGIPRVMIVTTEGLTAATTLGTDISLPGKSSERPWARGQKTNGRRLT